MRSLSEGRALQSYLLQDWACNPEGKSRAILLWFRLARACRRGQTPLPRSLERLVDRSYRTLTAWFLATEIHPDVTAGARLQIYHCHSVVLHPGTVLGSRCVLRAGVCIGTKTDRAGYTGPAPRLGDGVDIGVGALLIGDITIGDEVTIGAGSVVVKSVATGTTVAGNPAVPIG